MDGLIHGGIYGSSYGSLLTIIVSKDDSKGRGSEMADKLKRGIYETTYGNAAYVGGPNAKTAYDLDRGERVPMAMVTEKLLRSLKSGEKVIRRMESFD